MKRSRSPKSPADAIEGKVNKVNPYTDARVVDVSDLAREIRHGTGWRRGFFGSIGVIFGLIVILVILASKDHTEGVLYKEDRSGDIALVGMMAHERTPTPLAVKNELTSWITAVRDVETKNAGAANDNASLVLAMIATGTPAEAAYRAFLVAQSPVRLANAGWHRRVPVGDVEVDRIGDSGLTYRIAWKEYEGQGNADLPSDLHQYSGTVTLAQPPEVPNDPGLGQYNPAGVYISSFDFNWGEGPHT